MDKPKTQVVKSKSSNSTSETKKNTQKNNKKSRSNAEFQPKTTIYTQGIQPLLKKRGVYVEKKATTTKISINTRDRSPDVLINKPQPSPPRPIPRPGRKRFLASVLSILSKSTNGTQCPDATERLRKMDKTNNKRKKRRDEEVIEEVSVTTPYNSKRKSRYRSKILNNYTDSEVEPVIVLQSTKHIAQTPSNNSECIHDKNTVSTYVNPGTLRWAESLPPLDQKNLDTTEPIATNSKKVRLIDSEPKTIIDADLTKRVDENFYNFFVDVLKTSFSVFSVKTDFDKDRPLTANSSKVNLEINESVAGKLNSIPKIKEIEFKDTCDVSQKPASKYFYNNQPDENQQWEGRQLLENFQPDFSYQYLQPKRRRQLKSDSCTYRKAKPLPNITTSLPMPNWRKTQKNRKKDFINSLKEQLQMKADTYEEPQNFYQALKVIARNKRRYQQATTKRPSEGDVHVCQFKRRRVLSAKPNGKQSNYYPEARLDPFIFDPYFKTRNKKHKIIAETENQMDESNHSLEVVGYDYETKEPPLLDSDKDSKVIYDQSNWLSRLPSPSTLIEDFDIGIFIDYSESGTSIKR